MTSHRISGFGVNFEFWQRYRPQASTVSNRSAIFISASISETDTIFRHRGRIHLEFARAIGPWFGSRDWRLNVRWLEIHDWSGNWILRYGIDFRTAIGLHLRNLKWILKDGQLSKQQKLVRNEDNLLLCATGQKERGDFWEKEFWML